MFYVYEFRDHTGKVFYVGKGSKKRMASHEARARRGVKSHFYNKLRKLWANGHRHQTVIVFESLFEEHAFEEEKRLIKLYGRDNLTNQTDGGDGPSNPSQEVRKKIARAHTGKSPSPETREKMRLAKLGKPRSEEIKAKISAKQRTIKKPWAREIALQNLANMPSSKGRKWTQQQRERFRASRLGHTVSQETIEKIRATKRAKKLNLL